MPALNRRITSLESFTPPQSFVDWPNMP